MNLGRFVRLDSRFLACFILVAVLAAHAAGETIARHGDGWLERIDGYLVLHLAGTPYEMGQQHGLLLRDHVRENLQNLLHTQGDKTIANLGLVALKPRDVIAGIVGIQRPHVPEKYWEEMRGLADGAGLKLEDVQSANFIPELFHCSGFAVMNSATADGTLYHGRILDYGVDLKLQDHAVLIVAQPKGGIPFVNVGYAGFIGSVTGMNARQVSIGEMGGGGIGHWDGVPMALLVREVLESAGDLDQAIAVFRDNPRTCQYFYVLADGKDNRATAMEASWDRFELIHPGTANPRLPHAISDALVLSAGDRYQCLADRVESEHGKLTAESALRLMDRPVAMKSNLHNALFEPHSTRLWIANAGTQGEPAAGQPYHAFQLTELLSREP